MPMRPVSVRVSSATFSNWIPVNRYPSSFAIGFGVSLSSGASLTYTVQHTFDDIYERTYQRLSRSTTSLTINKTNHGLSVADWVQITGSPIWDGQYAVASVTDANNFVVTVANTGVTAGNGWIQTARLFPHEDVASETTSMDGNYQFPPRASRLIISSYSSGFADFTLITGGN